MLFKDSGARDSHQCGNLDFDVVYLSVFAPAGHPVYSKEDKNKQSDSVGVTHSRKLLQSLTKRSWIQILVKGRTEGSYAGTLHLLRFIYLTTLDVLVRVPRTGTLASHKDSIT